MYIGTFELNFDHINRKATKYACNDKYLSCACLFKYNGEAQIKYSDKGIEIRKGYFKLLDKPFTIYCVHAGTFTLVDHEMFIFSTTQSVDLINAYRYDTYYDCIKSSNLKLLLV